MVCVRRDLKLISNPLSQAGDAFPWTRVFKASSSLALKQLNDLLHKQSHVSKRHFAAL